MEDKNEVLERAVLILAWFILAYIPIVAIYGTFGTLAMFDYIIPFLSTKTFIVFVMIFAFFFFFTIMCESLSFGLWFVGVAGSIIMVIVIWLPVIAPYTARSANLDNIREGKTDGIYYVLKTFRGGEINEEIITNEKRVFAKVLAKFPSLVCFRDNDSEWSSFKFKAGFAEISGKIRGTFYLPPNKDNLRVLYQKIKKQLPGKKINPDLVAELIKEEIAYFVAKIVARLEYEQYAFHQIKELCIDWDIPFVGNILNGTKMEILGGKVFVSDLSVKIRKLTKKVKASEI